MFLAKKCTGIGSRETSKGLPLSRRIICLAFKATISPTFPNLYEMIENGFSKVNPSTFSIYQITDRPIEGIWTKSRVLSCITQKQKMLPFKHTVWSAFLPSTKILGPCQCSQLKYRRMSACAGVHSKLKDLYLQHPLNN